MFRGDTGMSQKKVDAYKKEKANREKLIKKEKRIFMIEKIIVLVVCVALVCWVGFSIYRKASDDKQQQVVDTQINLDALDDYIYSLDQE